VKTLPLDAHDLNPAWLSEVLGTEVTGVELLDHAFATNQRAKLGLTYATTGAGPATMFAKLAPVDPAHREMVGAMGMGEREARFYADVAPVIDLRVPRSYFADAADDGGFVILLEDLAVAGCRFSMGEWGVGADEAAGALEELARFHARFEDQAARDAVAPWLEPQRPKMSAPTAERMRYVIDTYRDVLTPEYVEVGELYVSHHAQIDDLWHAGPQTMIHGDTHIGNVFLDGHRVGFHDWGLSRRSTHLRDVSYFLTMSVEPDARRANERELLRTYLGALRAAGGIEIGEDEAWLAHRVQASYTVVATFLAFMPSYLAGDGQELGVDLRQRSEQALVDLDVVPALQAALGV
jgi:hypothetical protein